MTNEQEKIAEHLIDAMKQNKGSIDWRNNFMNKLSVDKHEMSLVIKALRELEIIEDFKGDTTYIRLTEKNGWTFPGFDAQRHNEKAIKDRQEEISNLTLKKLKLDQFPARFWWLLLLISAVISIVTTWVNNQIEQTSKPSTPTQQEQSLPSLPS